MRTDRQVLRDVLARLEFEPTICPAHIAVTVKHGVVTLTGMVPNLVAQMTVETLIKEVPGVVGIVNDIDLGAAVVT